MRRADSWKHAEGTRASHAPAFEACGSASTRHSATRPRKAHMHRQQTTYAAPPRSECGRSHRPPVRGETSGTWIRPPSGVGATSNKGRRKTKRARKGRAH
eukprot:scaffold10803_cov133-Isochrysis_galbana.AAC.6